MICPPAEKIVEILLDYACAAKCPFCYNPPLTAEVLSQRLSTKQAAEILFARRLENFDGAWLTGGEVTQRPDLAKILAVSRKLGYRRIQIGTNGVRTADAKYCRTLARAGLNFARVSIHGATAAAHDKLLGLPGSFERAVKSLSTLQDAGVAVGVNFVLNRLNLAEVEAFAAAALGDWGVNDVEILFPHSRGMMEINAAEIGISYKEAAEPIRRAVEAAARIDPSAGLRLINFPPCTLDRALLPRVGDWKREDFAGHGLATPTAAAALETVKSGQKAQGPGCRGCAIESDCLGFESDYARVYGSSDFAAWRTMPHKENTCPTR